MTTRQSEFSSATRGAPTGVSTAISLCRTATFRTAILRTTSGPSARLKINEHARWHSASEGLRPGDRRTGARGRSRVETARADQPIVFVLFHDVRAPTAYARTD